MPGRQALLIERAVASHTGTVQERHVDPAHHPPAQRVVNLSESAQWQ